MLLVKMNNSKGKRLRVIYFFIFPNLTSILMNFFTWSWQRNFPMVTGESVVRRRPIRAQHWYQPTNHWAGKWQHTEPYLGYRWRIVAADEGVGVSGVTNNQDLDTLFMCKYYAYHHRVIQVIIERIFSLGKYFLHHQQQRGFPILITIAI